MVGERSKYPLSPSLPLFPSPSLRLSLSLFPSSPLLSLSLPPHPPLLSLSPLPLSLPALPGEQGSWRRGLRERRCGGAGDSSVLAGPHAVKLSLLHVRASRQRQRQCSCSALRSNVQGQGSSLSQCRSFKVSRNSSEGCAQAGPVKLTIVRMRRRSAAAAAASVPSGSITPCPDATSELPGLGARLVKGVRIWGREGGKKGGREGRRTGRATARAAVQTRYVQRTRQRQRQRQKGERERERERKS
eukprot:3285655-Rhodomonas_salina.1